MNSPLLKYALSVGGIMMKKIVQNSYLRKRERLIPPQPVKQSLQTDKSEAKVEEEWELGKKDSVIKKDTGKWVEEQNEYFRKKKKEK